MIGRVFADEGGETHLEVLDLPRGAPSAPGLSHNGIAGIPVTTMDMSEMLEKRRSLGLHPAPRRQLVVVVRGAFEISASDGNRKRFERGDLFLADDVAGRGHHFEDVGGEPLFTVQVGLDAEWTWPDPG